MWPSFLLHVVPGPHGDELDIPLVLVLLGVGVLASALLGLVVAHRIATPRARTRAAALSFGALLFLLFDLLKESAGLGQALVARPLLPLGLALAFAAGALVLGGLARDDAPRRTAWLWTMGIALHGMGEGWIVGTEPGADIFSWSGASFLLHKAIEAFTIVFVARAALGGRDLLALPAALAALAVAAAALGAWRGPGVAPMALFAAGAGAAAHALLRLGSGLRADPANTLLVALGVLLVYGAGILHEVA